jgi:hypothetical protein
MRSMLALEAMVMFTLRNLGGTAAWNAFVHVLMVVGVFALLLVPRLERRVDHHVMSG